MNTSAFNRRLDKVQAALPRQNSENFSFDYSLFTPVEQAELQLFVDSFPPAFRNTNELSGERLFQFGCWLRLEKALRDGNVAEAEKWRRRRTISLEQLRDRFLNLDISSLPTDCNDPGPKVVENGCIYHFNRTHYRHSCWLVSRSPERHKDDMWRWIEYFEDH